MTRLRCAALALAATGLLMLAGCSSEADESSPSESSPSETETPPTEAESPSSPSSTDTPTQPSRQVFDVSDLETGAPPRLAWAERVDGAMTIHGPSGDTLAPADLSALAPMGSGYVIQVSDEDGFAVRWISSSGKPGRRSWTTGPGLGVSPQGKAVAFTVAAGGVRVIDSEADRVLQMPDVPSKERATPVSVSGEDCKEDETNNGCMVFVNSNRRNSSWLTSSHGIVDTTPFRLVSTGHDRWLGGITRITDTGSCSAMAKDLRIRWRTCRNQLSDISPSEQHALASAAYVDGLGPTTLDILTMTDGKPFASWTSAKKQGGSATYFDQAWEDDEHVLVVTLQQNRWAVVRLDLDGSMEYAVAPRRGSSRSVPLHLQTR